MYDLPPSFISTTIESAPASIEFSTNSLTTEIGPVTTSPAAILSDICLGSLITPLHILTTRNCAQGDIVVRLFNIDGDYILHGIEDVKPFNDDDLIDSKFNIYLFKVAIIKLYERSKVSFFFEIYHTNMLTLTQQLSFLIIKRSNYQS